MGLARGSDPRLQGHGGAALPLGLAMVVWVLPHLAHAQDQRPSENDMFGGSSDGKPPEGKPADAKPARTLPASPDQQAQPQPGARSTDAPPEPASSAGQAAAPPAEPPAAAASAGGARDQALLGTPDAGPQLSSDIAPDNPLTIGGQLYLRTQSSGLQHTYPDRWSLSSPNLLDTYFDARPNDRVRAFIRGRVSYDPTAPPSAGTAVPGSSGGALAGGSATGFTTLNAGRGPNAVLDQMWIAFDIEHAVFVTAGKQHVKWGTGRFWTPTDFLHPVKRNPLDVFDARPGTTLVKLHVPWEARAWNFYAFGVIEDPNTASNTLRQVAGAGRAELVEGPAELGLDFLVKRDQQPKVGADLSIGVGDFDLYTDVGLRAGSEINIVNQVGPVPLRMCGDGTMVPDYANASRAYTVTPTSGIKPQVVGGLTWARKYNDNDVLTIGGEYFYNSVGYADPAIYPGLFLENQLNFFYTGRHYAAVFASLPAPYSWNYTNFTLSTIGNLSDRSFVTRLDYSVTLLTHLTFEAFAGVHYGHVGGEFRLGFPTCDASGNYVQAQPPLVDLGVALRLKI